MTPSLAYNVWRCHATHCPERETCLRWLDRNTGAVHAASLSNDDGTCSAKLPSLAV